MREFAPKTAPTRFDATGYIFGSGRTHEVIGPILFWCEVVTIIQRSSVPNFIEFGSARSEI